MGRCQPGGQFGPAASDRVRVTMPDTPAPQCSGTLNNVEAAAWLMGRWPGLQCRPHHQESSPCCRHRAQPLGRAVFSDHHCFHCFPGRRNKEVLFRQFWDDRSTRNVVAFQNLGIHWLGECTCPQGVHLPAAKLGSCKVRQVCLSGNCILCADSG